MGKKADPTELIKKANAKLLGEGRKWPFSVGDTVRVHVRVKEGDKTRIQVFEGIVIYLRRHGVSSSFMVRKISFGVGVERIFPLYSPVVEKVVVISKGHVRRAKLYYLQVLRGRASRIESDTVFGSSEATEVKPQVQENQAQENVKQEPVKAAQA